MTSPKLSKPKRKFPPRPRYQNHIHSQLGISPANHAFHVQARDNQKEYTSFPGYPTATPLDENYGFQWTKRVMSVLRSSTSSERTALLPQQTGDVEQQQLGLPRLSRQCLISEIKCYGKYILPVLLVFVVLVFIIAFGVFHLNQSKH